MSISVIVVGFGDEPVLEECLTSIREQLGPEDDVVLIDHGITTPPVSGIRIVTPERNGGFGAGCGAGVQATEGESLVFVNSDAVLLPGALKAVTSRLDDPTVGMVATCVVLADRPGTVNSIGLPVHLSGLSWCDGYGDPVERHQGPKDLASVNGAFFACSRVVWERLGGMDESYFMYHEDTDLSLRCHLAGLRVVYSPDAVAMHAYDFSRNGGKMFLLERNRFLTVLADFPSHLLLRVMPVIVLLEPLYLIIALRDGWWREKLRAWGWLARHAGAVRARRKRVQSQVRDVHALDALLVPAVTQTQLDPPKSLTLLNHVLTLYWSTARPRAATAPGADAGGRPDVVVLRTNPKDSSLPRLLSMLVGRYRTTAYVWDRKGDYTCPVSSPRLIVRKSTRQGEYYRISTLIKVARLQPWFLWSVLRARPKVVHAMDLDTGIVGLLASRLLRVPFVYQCLDPYAASLPAGWPRAIARVVGRVEDSVISAADLFVITDLLRMPQHTGASPRRIVELPNIPMTAASPQPFSESGLVVGYIGSLVPHRSLDLIVDTIGQLSDEGVRLVLGGFGPLEDELRRRAQRYPNVGFLGWVPDDQLMRTMGDFDVFVQIEDPAHPAYRWVSPNKVFESMALGRPIVVAQGTVAAQRVGESGHGLAIPFGDADALNDTLARFDRDREFLHELGRRGRSAFTTHWDPTRITARVLDALDGAAPFTQDSHADAVGP